MFLFATVGCIEEDSLEPVQESSMAETLNEFKANLRNYNNAMAFYLQTIKGQQNRELLIVDFLKNRFGDNSPEVYEFSFLVTKEKDFTKSRLDNQRDQNSLFAFEQIEAYINAVYKYDDLSEYYNFLEAEFLKYSNSDLSVQSNLEVSIWLAMQSEAIFLLNSKNYFFIQNLSMLNYSSSVAFKENQYRGSLNINPLITNFGVCEDRRKAAKESCEEDFIVAFGLGYAGVISAAIGSGGVASLPAGLLAAGWMAYEYWQFGKCVDRADDDYAFCQQIVK